jgi:acyl-CoA-binding protein
MSSIEERFEDAVDRVNGLPARPSNADLLRLYGLYKQATAGDAMGKRPGGFDLKGRAKYDAWAARKGMSRESAMEAYVAEVDRLLEASRDT